MYFFLIFSIAGPAAPSAFRRKLPQDGGGTEGGAGSESESREGEGAGEAGASVLRPRTGDTDWKTEEGWATAAGRGAGGAGAREAQRGAQCCPRWSQAQGVHFFVTMFLGCGRREWGSQSRHQVGRNIKSSVNEFWNPPIHRWSSKGLSWRPRSRGTCCCRRRTTCSKKNFTAWRGTDPQAHTPISNPFTAFSLLVSVSCVSPGGWRMWQLKLRRCLKLSLQGRQLSSVCSSSWRKRHASAASCPDSFSKLWMTHRKRCVSKMFSQFEAFLAMDTDI